MPAAIYLWLCICIGCGAYLLNIFLVNKRTERQRLEDQQRLLFERWLLSLQGLAGRVHPLDRMGGWEPPGSTGPAQPPLPPPFSVIIQKTVSTRDDNHDFQNKVIFLCQVTEQNHAYSGLACVVVPCWPTNVSDGTLYGVGMVGSGILDLHAAYWQWFKQPRGNGTLCLELDGCPPYLGFTVGMAA